MEKRTSLLTPSMGPYQEILASTAKIMASRHRQKAKAVREIGREAVMAPDIGEVYHAAPFLVLTRHDRISIKSNKINANLQMNPAVEDQRQGTAGHDDPEQYALEQRTDPHLAQCLL